MPDLKQATGNQVSISFPKAPFLGEVDESGRFRSITKTDTVAEDAGEFTSLGLVDLQVNGFGGVDFNAAGLTAEQLDRALTLMLATGVTRCLPTIITASSQKLRQRLAALDSAIRDSKLGKLMVAGIHLEGPFLSHEDGYAGCHPKDAMTAPSLELLDALIEGLDSPIRLITLAPEREGSSDFIRAMVKRGTLVAIGHTNASRDQIAAAVDAGACMSTHLGNGIAHLLEKNSNPLFAQLGNDQLAAGLIADGIHVAPYMLQSWIRAKETSRVALVTDATSAAAAPPGTYTLGDVSMERGEDGVVREPGSPYLAGSSATLDQCIRNVMDWFGIDIITAFEMARTTPLSLIGEADIPAIDAPAECIRWRMRDGSWFVKDARIGPWLVENEE